MGVELADSLEDMVAEDRKVKLKPYKLVIYREGDHFHPHRDTVRGPGHIGTLVYFLNSPFTGGELVVSNGNRSQSFSALGSWVAMYGDCVHEVKPVLSGTRVTLLFDIYNKPIANGYVRETPTRQRYDFDFVEQDEDAEIFYNEDMSVANESYGEVPESEEKLLFNKPIESNNVREEMHKHKDISLADETCEVEGSDCEDESLSSEEDAVESDDNETE